MMPIARGDLDRFAAEVERRYGLAFDERRLQEFRDVLRDRMVARNAVSLEHYLVDIADDPAEWAVIVGRVTVPETYFFRIEDHFRALRETVLPARMAARQSSRKLCIVSLGCASGEEPYTIAMVLREEAARLAGWDISIVGVDVNPAVLRKARAGEYTEWSLRATPEYYRQRYFKAAGAKKFKLIPDIRNAVTFAPRNLAQLNSNPWHNSVDVVFFRNVLMYFTAEASRRIIEAVAAMLLPNGYLFLSPAESLRGLTQTFTLQHTQDTFYYEKRDAAEYQPPVAGIRTETQPATWPQQISDSTGRIHALAGNVTLAAPLPSANEPRAAAGSWNVSSILEMLASDRLQDALKAMDALPPQASADADVSLLRAVLLTNAGMIAEAEQACLRLLARDDLNAGAHYLLALCREQAGDHAGAIEQDDSATYLDPSFAMPYLHRGILARRSGDVHVASRELNQATMLLAREDSGRILLFGGGFTREALKQLCERELRSCGGLG